MLNSPSHYLTSKNNTLAAEKEASADSMVEFYQHTVSDTVNDKALLPINKMNKSTTLNGIGATRQDVNDPPQIVGAADWAAALDLDAADDENRSQSPNAH